MTIRVFIVEDHPVYRDTLVEYVDMVPDLELCGVVATGEEALEGLEEVEPHVLVTDLALPGMSGITLVEEVRARWGLPCLILSGHAEAHHVERALGAGADGYVLKGRPGELSAAIRAVVEGKRFLSESLARVANADGGPDGG